jgi:hypothetical protein
MRLVVITYGLYYKASQNATSISENSVFWTIIQGLFVKMLLLVSSLLPNNLVVAFIPL